MDMNEAIIRALEFGCHHSFEEFDRDEIRKWAVYSQIMILGEAANRVSKGIQQAHSQIPWRKIISMRNVLVHGYDEVDWKIVWNTLKSDLPELKSIIAGLIPEAPT